MKVMEKYLSLYREQEAKDIAVNKFYSHVLVIPAYKEGKFFIDNLLRLNENVDDNVLAIVVVNNPANASVDESKKNICLIQSIKDLGKVAEQNEKFNRIQIGKLDLLVIGPVIIDDKMAVGKARKIGADVALSLIQQKKIGCPLIYTTDADAILPKNYFSLAESSYCENDQAAGYIYPFIHLKPNCFRQRQSIDLYERRLYQYVNGLSSANSLYAFHTIGSIIAINALAYAQVRGYPKIAAGEDFYLLNKLRKVGPIVSLMGEPIKLSARVSDRVPFGTGPALKNIMQFDDVLDAPIFYHPAVFEHLRWLLQNIVKEFSIDQLIVSKPTAKIDASLACQAFLSLKGVSDLRRHLGLLKHLSSKTKAFHDWFDAFRTLKFIHNLRDDGLAMQSYNHIAKFNF